MTDNLSPNPSPLRPPPVLGAPPVIEDDRPWLLGMLISAAFAVLAVIAGALLYGLIAYYTESVYFYLTVICGVMVGAALAYGFPRRNWLLMAAVLIVPAVALALVSIALGELIFYTLIVVREFQASYTEAAGEVLASAVEIVTDSEVYLPYGLSALGALLGVVGVLRRR